MDAGSGLAASIVGRQAFGPLARAVVRAFPATRPAIVFRPRPAMVATRALRAAGTTTMSARRGGTAVTAGTTGAAIAAGTARSARATIAAGTARTSIAA